MLFFVFPFSPAGAVVAVAGAEGEGAAVLVALEALLDVDCPAHPVSRPAVSTAPIPSAAMLRGREWFFEFM
ncbi:hypothetical protein [Streptantibioticus silvisoli]|uniref:Secreted protein n=1 Tax=Streptantibioticus silvisoli TaxID=2705255 RepID=A0ABT6W576_9ACTN|nr:hypothetical protein [Streptantibioticus silvisoli]MDI5965910.1 hypothetical protein [Streptantibioticus silvisoli]